MKKSTARARRIVITVDYHYTSAGRRNGLRKDIAKSLSSAVIRRLQRHGALVVDSVEIRQDDDLELGA